MDDCPPEQTTTLQLIQSFVRYARAHRTELQGNAVVAVFRALREATLVVLPQPSSASRFTAGAAGFLLLIQFCERPER
jgi:hypothetical protein